MKTGIVEEVHGPDAAVGKSFHDMPIHPVVLGNIARLGFVRMTPIQERTLPISLAGRDVAGQAQTGTGKTAAFLIAIMTRLLSHPPARKAGKPGPRALIVAPTRELAVQIEADAVGLGEGTGLRVGAVYGGVDYEKQRRMLTEGLDILIGTPGRLIDYFKQKVYTLDGIEVLVIDEADRMFDMGFIPDLRYMLRRMPKYDRRQSMLFSATLSARVMELSYEHMNNPEKVSVSPEQVTAERVKQALYHVERREKLPLLLGILRREAPNRTLIFVNTKRQGERLAERLTRFGHETRAITGDIPQKKRLRMLSDFKEGQLPFLVATDVASRGLHIEAVSHVINYDLPQDPEDYVHRIGRTARAGAEGTAISLACEEFVFGLEAIEELIGHKIPVEWASEEMFVEVGHGSRESHPSAQAGRGESSARPRGGAPPGRGGGPHRRRRT